MLLAKVANITEPEAAARLAEADNATKPIVVKLLKAPRPKETPAELQSDVVLLAKVANITQPEAAARLAAADNATASNATTTNATAEKPTKPVFADPPTASKAPVVLAKAKGPDCACINKSEKGPDCACINKEQPETPAELKGDVMLLAKVENITQPEAAARLAAADNATASNATAEKPTKPVFADPPTAGKAPVVLAKAKGPDCACINKNEKGPDCACINKEPKETPA